MKLAELFRKNENNTGNKKRFRFSREFFGGAITISFGVNLDDEDGDSSDFSEINSEIQEEIEALEKARAVLDEVQDEIDTRLDELRNFTDN